ncbi:hypothetical protein AB0E67_16870 [Streptomyces sp. NPDC032161]
MSQNVGGWWTCWSCGNSVPGYGETSELPSLSRTTAPVAGRRVPVRRMLV